MICDTAVDFGRFAVKREYSKLPVTNFIEINCVLFIIIPLRCCILRFSINIRLLVVEAPLSNARYIKARSTQKLVDPLLEQCDRAGYHTTVRAVCISVRQHYKVVIIPSVTSMHRPDMIWNALKGTLISIQKILRFSINIFGFWFKHFR